jgi:hypothetical protein
MEERKCPIIRLWNEELDGGPFLLIEISRYIFLTFLDVFLGVPPHHNYLSAEKNPHTLSLLWVLSGKPEP